MNTQIYDTALNTFDPDSKTGFSWVDFMAYSDLTHLTELVSLDGNLNRLAFMPDLDSVEDWDYIITDQGMVMFYFNDLDYVLKTGKEGFDRFKALEIEAKFELLKAYLLDNTEGEEPLIEKLNTTSRGLVWDNATSLQFKGNLRFLTSTKHGNEDQTNLFLIRSVNGEIFILSIPDRANPYYQNLEGLIESKLYFDIKVLETDLDKVNYRKKLIYFLL